MRHVTHVKRIDAPSLTSRKLETKICSLFAQTSRTGYK